MSAALALFAARSAGVLVLRVYDQGCWWVELRTYKGPVPEALVQQFRDLEPFVLVLLRELALGRESLPI